MSLAIDDKQIIPVLEEIHPGCSMRIASLSERLSHYKEDQQAIASLLIKTIEQPQGLCRKTLSKLPITARGTIIAEWLKQSGSPPLSGRQLEEVSCKISNQNPPGCLHLSKEWKIKWVRKWIQIENPN